jgi:hypothetical protein
VRTQGYSRQGSRFLRAEGRAVLSLGADKQACVRLRVLTANSARLNKHVTSSFVQPGSVVVEVGINASRLLKEPGDVLYVR